MRTMITDINLKTLEEMYQAGMNSKGKMCEAQHKEAEEKTGLPLQVIKDWVGNRRKVESGRKYEYKKSIYTKGMTGFNCFVSEKKDQFQKITDWAPAWNSLSVEEKELYKGKAKDHTVADAPRAAKALLKKIFKQVLEIGSLGVDIAVLGVDKNDGNQIFLGEKKTGAFFSARPKILEELYSFHSFGCETKEENESLKELRKKAQKHMNDLYSKAAGKSLPFPYKKVTDGQLIIHGLPGSILPLRTVSSYGEKNLKVIMSVEEIFIERPTHNEQIHDFDEENGFDVQDSGINAEDENSVESSGLQFGLATSVDYLQELLLPSADSELETISLETRYTPGQTSFHIPSAIQTFKETAQTKVFSDPKRTHTITKPLTTHTMTSPEPKYTRPSTTNTLKQPTTTYTATNPTCTHTVTKSFVTHTVTNPISTHTNITAKKNSVKLGSAKTKYTSSNIRKQRSESTPSHMPKPSLHKAKSVQLETLKSPPSNTSKPPQQDTTKTSQQDTIKTSHQATAKLSQQDTAKTTQQDTRKTSNQDTRKTLHQDTTKTSHQDTTITSHQDTTKKLQHDIAKISQQDAIITSHQATTKTLHHATTKTSHQNTTKTSHQDTTKTSLWDATKTSHQGTAKTSLQDATKKLHHGTAKTSLQDATKTSHQGTAKISQQDETKKLQQDTGKSSHSNGKREKQKSNRKISGRKKAKIDYVVKDILDCRVDGNERLYLVHWDGYSHSDNTWEPECNISPFLIGQFYSKNFNS